MTNMARLTATLMEHSDGAIPMVIAVMAKMKLPLKAFQEWMRHTDTDKCACQSRTSEGVHGTLTSWTSGYWN